jgi:hypothetical protein
MYPDVQTIVFHSTEANVNEIETKNKERFTAWAKGLDAAIAVVGDWRSCTKFLVCNGIAIEDFGKPVVLLANNGFVTDAQSAASSRGMPGIRIVGESVACESTVKSEIEEGIAAAMKDVIEGLTKPLGSEEKSPKQQTGKTSRVAFKGSLQEVNRFYYSKGWTDGLPIIPPTEAAVVEMMTGTDLPPDHVVATIIPRKNKLPYRPSDFLSSRRCSSVPALPCVL